MWSPLVNSYTFIMVLDAMPLRSASSLIRWAETTFTRPMCAPCPGPDPMRQRANACVCFLTPLRAKQSESLLLWDPRVTQRGTQYMEATGSLC